jgi:carbon monoxide dehydrogenase subunit G
MKIEGATDIPAPRDRVWSAFLDPAVIAKAMPGCEELVGIGPDEYKAVMKVGVGPVKGTFEGKVRLFDQAPPHRYRMAVEGTGAPGFVRGEAAMELTEAEGGTRVTCSGDVQVGGLIASVGQRLLGGVARMMLDQFFSRMHEILAAPQ